MIVSQAPEHFPSSFSAGHNPQLLYSSNITIDFSNHPRLLHMHDDRLELLYVRTGFGTYIVGDHMYNLEPGNIIVCNSNILHDEMPEYNHQLSMLVVAIKGVKIKGLPDNQLIPSSVQPILKASKKMFLMESLFQSIFDSLSFDTSDIAHETTHYMMQALLSLVLEGFTEYGKPSEVSLGSDSENIFHQIKEYIDEHYAENLSLQQISEQFYISQSYLSHLFKRKLGFSPIQYITRRRIGEAQLLLVLSDLSVTDIATRVGFDSLSHFNAQFKRYVGITPLIYRRKNISPDFTE